MDKTTNVPLFANLSSEVIDHVFSFLPQPVLRLCRLLNHSLCAIATPRLFRHIRLDAEDAAAAYRFKRIVASEVLRSFVREITCDTGIGPSFEYHNNSDYDFPEPFLRALPYLRFFANLQTLHIRFNEHCGVGVSDPNYGWGYSIEETNDFRYAVLGTIFQCLAGSWSVESQKKIEDESSIELISSIYEYESEEEEEEVDESAPPPVDLSHLDAVSAGPIALKTLTIANLADFNDERLTKSDAFRNVIESPGITALKLLITTEDDSNYPGYSPYFPEKYDMFEQMPQTWLAPELAENLRVLSLYSHLKWGWNVHLDFRRINPLAGPKAGFPNLRVLALGSYIFTQDWQVDWIASLGKQNDSGGLEELYLDKCAIMYHAWHQALFDDSDIVLGNDPDGKELVISNAGIPTKESYTRFMNHPRGWAASLETQAKSYSLRWYQVLHRWKETMSGLKIFKMGHGSWDDDPPAHTICAIENLELNEADEPSYLDTQKLSNMYFRDYDCPSPLDAEFGTMHWGEPYERYLNGTGICQEEKYQLEYTRVDHRKGSNEWFLLSEDRMHDAPGMEAEAASLDRQALESLLETVEERNLRV